MQIAPYIPDNAPFSPEQRAWLNGFLAGLFSATPGDAAQTSVRPASLQIAVYFASQTGTAERLAKKIGKELKAEGHTVEISSVGKLTPAVLAKQNHALFLASTYGEGDPPESAQNFWNHLLSEAAPPLQSLRYGVFCLGDRHYEHFCKFGIALDERLHGLGATRFLPPAESDVEVDAPFEQWKRELKTHLTPTPEKANAESPADHVPSPAQASPATTITDTAAHAAPSPVVPQEPEHRYTRDDPFHAVLRERRALTSAVSSKLTLHLSFALDDPAMHYQAGDACGVIAQNDPALVDDLLAHLPFNPGRLIEIPRTGSSTVRDALQHHLQPTRLTRKMVQYFAERTGNKTLTALLPPEQGAHLEAYMYDRGLIDLLTEFPHVLADPSDLVAILPRLAPRLYSISSSPAAHGREVHCTVAVVRYRSHNRERGGIASTMLSDRVHPGDTLPIYIQPNKKFRLPSNPDTPMIMVGPGTGIAPFRAFLHERQALGHTGKNWLFFGERSAETDFLYCHELRDMCDTGHLTRLDTAFSRDQEHKIYVQDRLVEHGAELWRWLDEGAQFFVCGDASRMAKDVDAALHTVIAQHGQMDPEAAREYVSDMHDHGRYHRDVY